MEKLKVVVVEDEYYVRKGIINALVDETMEYEVVGESKNGEEGVEIIERLRPDLVIADIEMPLMNGIEMVKMLKSKHVDTNYIFLTAHQRFTYVHSALRLEVVDYLLKPFRIEELKECIKKLKAKLNENFDISELDTLPDKNITVNNKYIKDILKYVRDNYKNDISNITAANFLDINEAYFCRLFKKETGYTFGQYLTHYRIHVGAELLKNFDLRVNEVAFQVGFSDSNYFSLIFKKIMKMTPSQYQNIKYTKGE